jgi:hypothetical protein
VWARVLHETRMRFSRKCSKDQRHAHVLAFARFHLSERTPHKHVIARYPALSLSNDHRSLSTIDPDTS